MTSAAYLDEMIAKQAHALKKAQKAIDDGFEQAFEALRDFQTQIAEAKVAEHKAREMITRELEQRSVELDARQKLIEEKEKELAPMMGKEKEIKKADGEMTITGLRMLPARSSINRLKAKAPSVADLESLLHPTWPPEQDVRGPEVSLQRRTAVQMNTIVESVSAPVYIPRLATVTERQDGEDAVAIVGGSSTLSDTTPRARYSRGPPNRSMPIIGDTSAQYANFSAANQREKPFGTGPGQINEPGISELEREWRTREALD